MKKIIITGGSGFLGTQITNRLLEIGGYEIVVMDLYPSVIENPNVLFFKKNLSEAFEEKDYQMLRKPHAVIHLAGKNIFGRFTKEHKKAIWDSRVKGTRNLVELLKHEEYKPKSLVAASAVGFYGNQPGEILVESSERKNYYFLSDLVEAWEEESLRAQADGINVSCIRNGHIIGQGGILNEVASTFQFGIGGILGSGKGHFPWVDVRDLVEVYLKCISMETPSIINGVSNARTTQSDFAHAIGKVKNTKFYINIKEWMLALKFGGFAKEMLVDQQVESESYNVISFIPKHTNVNMTVDYYLTENEK